MRLHLLFLLQLLLLLNFNLNAQTWDQRPETEFITDYEVDFSQGAWNNTTFYDQWNTQPERCFSSTDISSGYLLFNWIARRVMITKEVYFSPYTFEVNLSHTGTNSYSGIVIRANPSNLDEVQNSGTNSFYNQEGVAFYPSSTGDALVVQVSGTYAGEPNTPTYNVNIPKPTGLNSTLDRMRIRVEDYDTTIYVFINDIPMARIDLGDLSDNIYSSGKIYDSSMKVVGTFTGMEVERVGKLAISQRASSLRVYSVKIEKDNTKIPPDAPVNVLAFPQEASAIVKFEAPFYSGSMDITGYRVISIPGGKTKEGTSSPITITGLENYTSYTFVVQALSAAGESDLSNPSNSVIPTAYVVPDAPTEVTAFAKDASALVSFEPPANVGSWGISHYVVTSIPDGIMAESHSSPIVVSGLENGTTYTFVVKAVNEKGESENSSPSEPVTPVKSANLGVPICHIMPCCDNCKEGIKYLVNGSWVSSYSYYDINTARSMMQQIKDCGINIVCIDMTNYAQWVPEKLYYFKMIDNIAQVCDELNMQYFLHIGTGSIHVPEHLTALEYWNSVAGIILERWANKPNYRRYGFGDDRPILVLFEPGFQFWPRYNSEPVQNKNNFEKFSIATAIVNSAIPSEKDRYESDGWGYRGTNFNKSKSVRYTSANGGKAGPDTWSRLTPSQFAKEVKWVSQASEYSVYGSFDDACDNIFWGIAQTKDATDPMDRYPVDDPYAYYNIIKATLTPDTSGIDNSAIYYIPGFIRTGGEFNEVGINEGEWFDLNVDVASSGKYVVSYKVASALNNISLSLQMNGVEVDTINVQATGSIDTWIDVTKTINLNAGKQTLRLSANTGGWDLQRIEFFKYSEPKVTFLTPGNWNKFYGPTDLKVTIRAVDDNGVDNVKLFLNDELVRQDDIEPYEWSGALQNDSLLKALGAGTYILKAVATNEMKVKTESSIIVEVKPVETGVLSQNIKKQISVFPNPTTGSLTIQMNKDYHSALLNIYNNMGALVLKTTLENANSTVSIADFPAGIYLLEIIEDDNVFTSKIIKS